MTSTNAPTVVLCPGQGAQHVGMAKAWHDAHAVAADTFDAANDMLGFDLATLCFEGPEDQLNRTDVAQAAIYTASVACYRALLEQGELAEADITAAAGLSLGEFTALHVAGALGFEDGLKLVRLRGQAMQDAAEATPSSMVALIGAEEAQANELCENAREDGVLVPANFNAPGQIVVSGDAGACERAVRVAEAMGLKATPLTVAGAFHSPIMQSAAEKLAAALEQVDWAAPRVTVLANVTGEPHEPEIASIKRRLVEQLTQPVRWSQSMQRAAADYADARFIELAPGKVLAGLMRRIERKVKVLSHPEPTVPSNR